MERNIKTTKPIGFVLFEILLVILIVVIISVLIAIQLLVTENDITKANVNKVKVISLSESKDKEIIEIKPN